MIRGADRRHAPRPRLRDRDGRSCGPTTEEQQGLGSDKRESFAQFHQRFQLFTFVRCELAFIIPIHQLLQPIVGLAWQSKLSDGLDPFDGGVNCRVHRIAERW